MHTERVNPADICTLQLTVYENRSRRQTFPSGLFRAAEQAASGLVNVHLVRDLSLLPSHVQTPFPRLRCMTLTRLFVHFSSDQMKREQRRAAKQLRAPSGLTETAALSILPSASLFSYITSGYSSHLSKTVCSESAAILNHNFS